jgi:hypothetical protein
MLVTRFLRFLNVPASSVLLLCLILIEPSWAVKKTDILILRNGNNITGEIKELKFGKLEYKTDDIGTISVEWDKVVFLKSIHTFEFETDEGIKLFGTVDTDTTLNNIVVLTQEGEVSLQFLEVVVIRPLKSTFWKRMDGSWVSLGFSYTKASQIGQLNTNGELKYRTRKYESNLALNSTITWQEEKETTKRNSLSTRTVRIFQGWWLMGSKLTLEQNTELGIDLRLLLNGGGGRFLVHTNSSQLALIAGLQLSQEWVTTQVESQTNLESFATIIFQTYRYDSPKHNISVGFDIYPNLTPLGRVRTEFDITLRWELVKELFWDLVFYHSYDSEPPSGSSSDFGVVVSIGWEY